MATKKNEVIEVKPIEIAEATVQIEGTSPLIMHAWSAKAKRQILEKELKIANVKAREVKNPLEDFVASMYWLTPQPTEFTDESVGKALETARFGFPVTAFKQAAIDGAYRAGAATKADLRGAFYIVGDEESYYASDLRISSDQKNIEIIPNHEIPMSMVEIHSDVPVMREDMVVLSGLSRAADVRYRGEFRNWKANLKIRYNKNGMFTLEQIINFLNFGGFTTGVGEWRPQKDGEAGTFRVVA